MPNKHNKRGKRIKQIKITNNFTSLFTQCACTVIRYGINYDYVNEACKQEINIMKTFVSTNDRYNRFLVNSFSNIVNILMSVPGVHTCNDERMYNLFWRSINKTGDKKIINYIIYAKQFNHEDIIDAISNYIDKSLMANALTGATDLLKHINI